MRSLIQIFLSFLLLLILFYWGCVDENINPNTGNVNVHIYNQYLTPYNNCMITTGIYPMLIPNGNGNISFNNRTFPYKLFLKMLPGGSNFEIIDNIYSKEVNIVLPTLPELEDFLIDVIHPKITENQFGIIKFLGNAPFYSDIHLIYHDTSSTLEECEVTAPKNFFKITGKIIILIGTNESGNITSYDNFGEKDVALETGIKQVVRFDSTDLELNPGGINYTYNIQEPPNGTDFNSEILISFDDYNTASDMHICWLEGPEGSILIPANLPFKYKIKLYNSINSGEYYLSKWIKNDPGTSAFLDNSNVPGIFLPIDDAENITDTSTFYYDNDQSKGVYNLYFTNNPSWKNFLTDKNKITLGELKKAGLTFSPNTLYTWCFIKFSEFNSINDFLSQPYLLNPNYNSYINSTVRIFRTAP